MALVARGQPLEARHFGYGVLQHVVSRRWGSFSADERRQLAKLVYDKLSECGSAPADAPEPWMIKSKVATLMAQVVRQEGASMWTGLMPELAAGAGADPPSSPSSPRWSCDTSRRTSPCIIPTSSEAR